MDRGRIVKELPPSADNPRNSEGSFIARKDGSILFVYSRFSGGTDADDAPANLAQLISDDGGETWHDGGIILTRDGEKADNIMSVSLLRMADGRIAMFYVLRRGFDDSKAHFRLSDDEGETWGEERYCAAPALGTYDTNNDRVIRTSRGRIVVPACYFRTRTHISTDFKDISTLDFKAQTIYFYSDDEGKNWQESNIMSIPVGWSKSGLQEPGVIELSPGHLYGWARTDAYCQYEMFSIDDGATWSVPQPSRFRSPVSPMTIRRDPTTGQLLAFWNPLPEMPGLPGLKEGYGLARTPYVCAVSHDNGGTWSEPMVIEDDPLTAYCYTAVHFVGKDVLIAYCAGSQQEGYLNRLRIRKMPVPAQKA